MLYREIIAVFSEAGTEQWPSHVEIPPDLQLDVYPRHNPLVYAICSFALCFVSTIIFLFSLLAFDFQIDAPPPPTTAGSDSLRRPAMMFNLSKNDSFFVAVPRRRNERYNGPKLTRISITVWNEMVQ